MRKNLRFVRDKLEFQCITREGHQHYVGLINDDSNPIIRVDCLVYVPQQDLAEDPGNSYWSEQARRFALLNVASRCPIPLDVRGADIDVGLVKFTLHIGHGHIHNLPPDEIDLEVASRTDLEAKQAGG